MADDYDLGDLCPCGYPTLAANPAHAVSGIAWLGECITPDSVPHEPNCDPCDDGVEFMRCPWTPCTGSGEVYVTVTAGPGYPDFVDHGGQLYLNGWKDGNHDKDFCDTLCDGQSPEWIIRDELVTPGRWTYLFMDPGSYENDRSDGIFRFRLTSAPIGAYGFGLMDIAWCPLMPQGTCGYDSCGEVEDYIIHDFQLDVTLISYTATPDEDHIYLQWVTASEFQISHYDLYRDQLYLATLPSQGSGPVNRSYHYNDYGIASDQRYEYTLICVDLAGNREAIGSISAALPHYSAYPREYELFQNFPNPFNASTTIDFRIACDDHVSLVLYNCHGQLVKTLVDKDLSSGNHSVWLQADQLTSGIYIYSLRSGNSVLSRKAIILK